MEILLVVFLIIICAYILCLKTNKRYREDFSPYMEAYVAHRGLFNNDNGCPENSKMAFEQAVESKYCIELDVQLTKDGELVVFHDNDLKRMCGVEKKLSECTYSQLQEYNLLGTEQKIPTFTEVLSIIDKKVPLIIEIKTDGEYKDLCKKTAQILSTYNGEFCIESFHPMAVAWFRKNCPHILRGQLSTDYKKDDLGRNPLESFALTNLLFNFYTRPDFIAFNHKYKKNFSYQICKKIYNPINVAWTIRNEEELNNALNDFDIIIFDSFIP